MKLYRFFVACLTALAMVMVSGVAATAVGTTSGTVISSYATISADNAVSSVVSNTVDVTVDPVYGLDTSAFSEPDDVKILVQGDYVDYEFGISNNGNATDAVRLEIGAQSFGGEGGAGAAWSVEVLDAVGAPLTWESGGTTSDPSGDAATATGIAPGENATFTLRVYCGSGADDGATMTFSVNLKTLNTPVGEYTGFNSSSYGGAAAVASAAKTAQVQDENPPVVTITAPIEGQVLTTTSVTLTGSTSPAAASGTVSIGSSANELTVDASGDFGQTVLFTEQGDNTIYVTAFDQVHNYGTDSVTVYVDSLPPETYITSPAENEEVNGTVVVTGTVTDINFSTYLLEYGPGDTPVAWGTIASSTVAVSGGMLGTWDTGGLYGTYTIRLTASDIYGNSRQVSETVDVGNSEIFEGTLAKGEWQMMSIPGIPKDADPRSFLGSSRYEVQQWDEDLESDEYMKKFTRSFALNYAGEGFWVKPYEGEIQYDVDARVTDSTTEYAMPLKVGWNQVGLPYNRESGMLWDNVYVKNTGTGEELSMQEAISEGWIDSTFNEYSNDGYVGRGLGDTLYPFEGYFLNAYVECELMFDPGEGRPAGIARQAGGRGMSKIIRPEYEWRMQLSARTGEARDTDNFAAELSGADNEFDAEDAGEPPTVDPYVSLYFENEDWQRRPGRYARDSRTPSYEVNEEKTWNFVVEVSRPGDNVKVSVANADKLPDNYHYVILDKETGTEFDPKETPEYTYTDSGQGSRMFSLRAIRLGGGKVVIYSNRFPAGWSLFSVPLDPQPSDVRIQLAGQVDDLQVFQYFDRELYNPDSPEKVDIQAGIGYWVYLDKEKEIEFEGRETSGQPSIEIPLVKGWNLIGNPYTHEIDTGTLVKIKKGEETLGLAEAVEAGWVDKEIYAYDDNTGGYERLEEGAALIPWKGYAVKALRPCKAVIFAEP